MTQIKRCPICGNIPVMNTESMEKPGGHGYPGCHAIRLKCHHCDLLKCSSSNTVGGISIEEAKKRATENWNEEVDRIERLMEWREKMNNLIEETIHSLLTESTEIIEKKR